MQTNGLLSGAIAGAVTALLITKDGGNDSSPSPSKSVSEPTSSSGSVVATPGKDGKDGVNGIDGKDGADGKNGTNGTDGKDGKDGVDGKDGTNGVDFAYDVSAITPEDGDVVYYEVAPGFAVALYRVA